MVCVTHEMGFAREVADRILFMDQGSILERAEPDAFFGSPQHPRARKFVVSVQQTHLEKSSPNDNDAVQLANSWTAWKQNRVASAGTTAAS